MNPKIVNESVIVTPDPQDALHTSVSVFFQQPNSTIEPFGTGNYKRRDKQLREFALQEPYLLSTIYTLSTIRSALSWEVSGSPKTARSVQEMLLNSDRGNGWESLISKISLDLSWSDSGAFCEIIRAKPQKGRNPWTGVTLGVNHLSSSRCFLTGNPLQPVIYLDEDGKYHLLNWWEVIHFTEMPASDVQLRNLQISFVSRVLKGAEFISAIYNYNLERVQGRNPNKIHLVGGVSQMEIRKIQETGQLDADNAGLRSFMPNLILSSLDPNAKVSLESINLAELPTNFDLNKTINDYIILLALSAGVDVQELGPLSGGALGSGAQSSILHQKNLVKGNKRFQKMISHKLKTHRVIPANVEFNFSEEDPAYDLDKAKASESRATTRKIRIESQEITPGIARQIAVDEGDLKPVYLVAMDGADITPSVTLSDDQNASPDMIAIENGATPLGDLESEPDVEITDETTPEPDLEKSLSPTTAFYTAKWFERLVKQNALQSVNPISQNRLDDFVTVLRLLLTHETTLATDDHWQDYALTKAAHEAGIQPHVLRQRLPSDYKVTITNTLVKTSQNEIIYKADPEPAPEAPKPVVCECGQPAIKVFTKNGLQPFCEVHMVEGLQGDFSNLASLVQAFNTQYVATGLKYGYNSPQVKNLVESAMVYSYALGNGGEVDFDTEFEKVAILLRYAEDPVVFFTTLNKMYNL